MKPEFHYRVRAVIIKDGYILLQQSRNNTYSFLPGGHIELGESIPYALERELMEELGVSSRAGRYLGAVEHEWTTGGAPHCEINHIFEVTLELPSPPAPPVPKETHLTFFWAEISKLAEAKLSPPPFLTLVPKWAAGGTALSWASTFKQQHFEAGE